MIMLAAPTVWTNFFVKVGAPSSAISTTLELERRGHYASDLASLDGAL
jgi:hypothetical protein